MPALRRSLIDEFPARMAANDRTGGVAKQFIIETRRDANGAVIGETRVVAGEQYAKACDGILDINTRGEVVYKVCFAAGTLVHTDQGLVPIEKIRVGTRVLSQPEDGGERAYRRVTDTVATLDQEVYAVQVTRDPAKNLDDTRGPVERSDAGADTTTLQTIIATANHPFWVAEPVVLDDPIGFESIEHKSGGYESTGLQPMGQKSKGQNPQGQKSHWLAAECLEPGMQLQLADGSVAYVHAVGSVRKTQYPGFAFAGDERSGAGVLLDTRGKQIKVVQNAGAVLAPGALPYLPTFTTDGNNAVSLLPQALELGEPHLTTVYNFTVEGFHTYYVGDEGVWVHNTNCTPTEAIDATIRKAFYEASCFHEDTWIWAMGSDGRPSLGQIKWSQPGYLVLSRSEVTGEVAARKVLRVFESISYDMYEVEFQAPKHPNPHMYPTGTALIEVTGNHPFWVKGKGWTPVANLRPNDILINGDGVELPIVSVNVSPGPSQVYNLEVEEFNTYFAGTAGVWVHNCNGVNASVTVLKSEATAPAPPPGLRSPINHQSIAHLDHLRNTNVLNPDQYQKAGTVARVSHAKPGISLAEAPNSQISPRHHRRRPLLLHRQPARSNELHSDGTRRCISSSFTTRQTRTPLHHRRHGRATQAPALHSLGYPCEAQGRRRRQRQH